MTCQNVPMPLFHTPRSRRKHNLTISMAYFKNFSFITFVLLLILHVHVSTAQNSYNLDVNVGINIDDRDGDVEALPENCN